MGQEMKLNWDLDMIRKKNKNLIIYFNFQF